MPINGLTPKQEGFAAAYIETGNASEAYRRHYDADAMNANTVGRAAHELLKNPRVAERIEELRAELKKRHVATIEKVVKELSIIAFADPGDYYEWNKDGVVVKDSATLTPEQRRAISGVEQTVTEAGGTIRVKLSDRQAALEKLGRHLGMFKDVHEHEHTGPDGGPIQIERIERVIIDPVKPETESK